MKAKARSFVYWKNIDKDIEEAAKNRANCARHKTDPTKAKVHYWEYPSMSWEHNNVDFAGPNFEQMFYMIVDAHSKWLEVYPMKGSSSIPEVPSTDITVPDVSPSSAKVTDSETRSSPVPERPFPRHSRKIRRPPKRLDL
ncbi:transposon Tf2-9 polyprotein [Trichonephila clavipes]|uniref:Transposon Tf2-9 polyprotein n=1 Tax=Trichonephila clavipes TaxID=2585209 RepID=A0A8X6RHM9_TRICX|nr:transposon Tf2-9 polyprotein [Trichonephila clavipes]